MGLFLCSLFCSIDLCVLMPLPDCSDYSGLVIQFDIRCCDPSQFVLLSQNCCWYSASFMVPHKFLKYLFYICEIYHWYCDRIALNLYIALGSMDIFMMLILPIHEHGICFYLFVSSLISFFSVLQFSKYNSFTSFVKFIPRYFIFLVAILNGIFSQFLFLIFYSWCTKMPLMSEY